MTTTTSDEIAVACRMSRSAARRALDALEGGGFCRVETRRGGDGVTVIRISTVKPGDDLSEALAAGHLHVLDIVAEGLTLEGGRGHLRTASSGHLEPADTSQLSGQSGGSRGQLNLLGQITSQSGVAPKPGVNLRSPVEVAPPDQDLSGPGQSDPESGTAEGEKKSRSRCLQQATEEPEGSEEAFGVGAPQAQGMRDPGVRVPEHPAGAGRGLAPARSGSSSPFGSGAGQLPLLGAPEFVADPVTPTAPASNNEPVRPEPIEDAEFDARQRAIAARLAKKTIPDRAYAAADWMRGYVVARFPHSYIARRPWGAAKVEDRLIWASQLTAIAERKPIGIDGRGWDEVARVLKWLFEEQLTADKPFVVMCPAALRKKWGYIQDARRRQALPQRKPASTAPRRTFTNWDDDWKPDPRLRRG